MKFKIHVMLNEAFESLEYEQGFDNEEIWLCKDEWNMIYTVAMNIV